MDHLKACALLSEAVYHKYCPDWLGVERCEYIIDVATDTFGIAYITENEVFITFMGSESPADWLNDFKIIKTDFFGIRAHKGFAECAGAVLSQVKAVINAFPGKKVVLTGHSLGGAIAVLVAVALRPNPVELITFGQPRVSTREELNLALYGEYVRVVNGSDAIPRKPWLGYSQHGLCLYRTNGGKQILDPSELKMFFDRLPTLLQRATDHSMSDYNEELGYGSVFRVSN